MTTHLTIHGATVAITVHPNGTRTVTPARPGDLARVTAALALWGMRL